jgi:hypothetical protein
MEHTKIGMQSQPAQVRHSGLQEQSARPVRDVSILPCGTSKAPSGTRNSRSPEVRSAGRRRVAVGCADGRVRGIAQGRRSSENECFRHIVVVRDVSIRRIERKRAQLDETCALREENLAGVQDAEAETVRGLVGGGTRRGSAWWLVHNRLCRTVISHMCYN